MTTYLRCINHQSLKLLCVVCLGSRTHLIHIRSKADRRGSIHERSSTGLGLETASHGVFRLLKGLCALQTVRWSGIGSIMFYIPLCKKVCGGRGDKTMLLPCSVLFTVAGQYMLCDESLHMLSYAWRLAFVCSAMTITESH